jgi:hypothetical protein
MANREIDIDVKLGNLQALQDQLKNLTVNVKFDSPQLNQLLNYAKTGITLDVKANLSSELKDLIALAKNGLTINIRGGQGGSSPIGSDIRHNIQYGGYGGGALYEYSPGIFSTIAPGSKNPVYPTNSGRGQAFIDAQRKRELQIFQAFEDSLTKSLQSADTFYNPKTSLPTISSFTNAAKKQAEALIQANSKAFNDAFAKEFEGFNSKTPYVGPTKSSFTAARRSDTPNIPGSLAFDKAFAKEFEGFSDRAPFVGQTISSFTNSAKKEAESLIAANSKAFNDAFEKEFEGFNAKTPYVGQTRSSFTVGRRSDAPNLTGSAAFDKAFGEEFSRTSLNEEFNSQSPQRVQSFAYNPKQSVYEENIDALVKQTQKDILQQKKIDLENQRLEERYRKANQSLGRADAFSFGSKRQEFIEGGLSGDKLQKDFNFFQPSRLFKDKETANAFLFSGLLGGPTSTAGAAIGGSVLGGSTGVLAGVTLVNLAVEAFNKVAGAMKDATEAANDLERASLGIASALDVNTIRLKGGKREDQLESFQANLAQGRGIQDELRKKLLPLGINSEISGYIGQALTQGFAGTTGFNDQFVGKAGERIAAFSTLADKSILTQPNRFFKDLSDITSQSPRAKSTQLGVQLNKVAPDIFKAQTAEEFEKASQALERYVFALKNADDALVQGLQIQGQLKNLQIELGEAINTAAIPGLKALNQALSDPGIVESAKKLGTVLGSIEGFFDQTAAAAINLKGGPANPFATNNDIISGGIKQVLGGSPIAGQVGSTLSPFLQTSLFGGTLSLNAATVRSSDEEVKPSFDKRFANLTKSLGINLEDKSGPVNVKNVSKALDAVRDRSKLEPGEDQTEVSDEKLAEIRDTLSSQKIRGLQQERTQVQGGFNKSNQYENLAALRADQGELQKLVAAASDRVDILRGDVKNSKTPEDTQKLIDAEADLAAKRAELRKVTDDLSTSTNKLSESLAQVKLQAQQLADLPERQRIEKSNLGIEQSRTARELSNFNEDANLRRLNREQDVVSAAARVGATGGQITVSALPKGTVSSISSEGLAAALDAAKRSLEGFTSSVEVSTRSLKNFQEDRAKGIPQREREQQVIAAAKNLGETGKRVSIGDLSGVSFEAQRAALAQNAEALDKFRGSINTVTDSFSGLNRSLEAARENYNKVLGINPSPVGFDEKETAEYQTKQQNAENDAQQSLENNAGHDAYVLGGLGQTNIGGNGLDLDSRDLLQKDAQDTLFLKNRAAAQGTATDNAQETNLKLQVPSQAQTILDNQRATEEFRVAGRSTEQGPKVDAETQKGLENSLATVNISLKELPLKQLVDTLSATNALLSGKQSLSQNTNSESDNPLFKPLTPLDAVGVPGESLISKSFGKAVAAQDSRVAQGAGILGGLSGTSAFPSGSSPSSVSNNSLGPGLLEIFLDSNSVARDAAKAKSGVKQQQQTSKDQYGALNELLGSLPPPLSKQDAQDSTYNGMLQALQSSFS